MSTSVWYYYGYGVCVTDLKLNEANFRSWLKQGVPELSQAFEKAYKLNNGDFDLTCVEVADNYCNSHCGLAAIIVEALNTVDGLGLLACQEQDTDDSYIMLQCSLPWHTSKKALGLTIDQYIQYLVKRLSSFTDITKERIGDIEVENWG